MQTFLPQGAVPLSHSLVASKVSLRLTRLKLVRASSKPPERISSVKGEEQLLAGVEKKLDLFGLTGPPCK